MKIVEILKYIEESNYVILKGCAYDVEGTPHELLRDYCFGNSELESITTDEDGNIIIWCYPIFEMEEGEEYEE